jgi:hypothetical protein
MALCCLGCKRTFTSPSVHYVTCRKVVKCCICERRVPVHLLARHVACHVGRIRDYEKAKQTNAVPTVKRHVCPTCGKTFVRQSFRDKHVKSCAASTLKPAPKPTVKIIDVDPKSVAMG